MARQIQRVAEPTTEIVHRPFWVRLHTIAISTFDDVPWPIQLLSLFLFVYLVTSILVQFWRG